MTQGENQERLKFSKNERLSKKIDIEAVFSKGRSFVVFPLKFLFVPNSSIEEGHSESNSILFTVPKRSFKRANDRNLLKRRLKESYRLNKHRLPDLGLKIAVIYLAKEERDFNFINSKLISGLDRLSKEPSVD